MKKIIAVIILFAIILTDVNCQVTMRLACPCPDGSAVSKVIAAAGETIKAKTGGMVILKINCDAPGSGNEAGIANGLKAGAEDAALLSAEGLIRVDREFAVLDLPFLIVSENELVRVQTQLAADFRSILENRGLTFCCWANPGPSYFFTGPRVVDQSGLRELRMAVLLYDSTARTFLSKFSVPVTPVGPPAIMPSLSAGTVNGYIGNCTNTAMYEWNMKVRYMIDLPVRYGTGALLIRKGFIDLLPAAHRETVMKVFKALGKDLNAALASDNATALRNITRLTITRINFPAGSTEEMLEQAESSWRENTVTLYSASMLQKIRTILGK
jgi:TRAP-type C4-dicarboxylate transport system substrate-binding protein